MFPGELFESMHDGDNKHTIHFWQPGDFLIHTYQEKKPLVGERKERK